MNKTHGKFYVTPDPVDPTTYRLNRNAGIFPTSTEKESNAELMGAAPDMDEALEEVLEWYEDGADKAKFPEERVLSALSWKR